MKRYLLVPALLLAAAFAGAAVTEADVTLHAGGGTGAVKSTWKNLGDCEAAADKLRPRGKYMCKVNLVTRDDPAPVVCRAPTAAAVTTAACPAGTTGTLTTTTTYTMGPAPTCVETSATSTSGICTPVVVTPPPAASTNAGVKQGAVEQKVCTTAITGKRTFTVTPATADAFAWDSLQAGDAVNITYGTYTTKLGLRGQGTAESPIILNGVTDATCNKPVFNGAGGRTAKGSAKVFSATPEYGESLGVIVIKRGPADAYGSYVPQYIIIQGIDVRGAAVGESYTTLAGAKATYGSAACIWAQQSAFLTIRNTSMSGCGFGYFGMSKDGMLSESNVSTTIANSRVFGNGKKGSYLEHNFYDQGASSHIYGNYIGAVIAGSEGSSYKSRQSGQDLHDNYIVCSARCLDLVHAEEQEDGVAKRSDYGTDWIHDNVIVSAGPEALHYGGDNMGEQGAESTLFVPTKAYRRNALFYGNTYTLTTSAWRANVFALSERATTVTAWGNKLTLNHTGGGVLSWVGYAGQVRLGAGNVVTGKQPEAARDGAAAVNYSVTTGAALPAAVK